MKDNVTFETQIKDLGLSIGLTSVLYSHLRNGKKESFKVVGDILRLSEKEIKSIEGIGEKRYNELVSRLKNFGIIFPSSIDYKKLTYEEKMNINLNKLDISPGLYYSLTSMNSCHKIKDIINFSYRDIIDLVGVGEANFHELKDALERVGVTFPVVYDFNSMTTQEILNVRLSHLDISNKLYRALKYANIYTISQVILLSKKEILKIRGIGLASYQELKLKLGNVGIVID